METLNGKRVLIDWKSGIEPAIYARYSKPNGEALIYMSPKPVFGTISNGWGFHKFNPWKDKFNHYLRIFLESGLMHQWKMETWDRMKSEYRDSLEDKSILEFKEKPLISVIALYDIQMLFYLDAVMLLACLVVFALENCVGNKKKQKELDKKRKAWQKK